MSLKLELIKLSELDELYLFILQKQLSFVRCFYPFQMEITYVLKSLTSQTEFNLDEKVELKKV